MGSETNETTTSDLPDGNPKTAAGAQKTPMLSVIPSPPLVQVGEVMRLGRAKYGPFNWRDHPVTASTYIDATMRHLMSWWDGETVDSESGQSHLAHAAASLFVIMDALATGNATDDRPKAGVTGALIAALAKSREAFKATSAPIPVPYYVAGNAEQARYAVEREEAERAVG